MKLLALEKGTFLRAKGGQEGEEVLLIIWKTAVDESTQLIAVCPRREPAVKALVSRAAQLARRGHFASGALEARARDLSACLRALLDAAQRRSQRIQERCELLQVRSPGQ